MDDYICGQCIKYIPDLGNPVAGYCIPKNRFTYFYGGVCGDFILRRKDNLERILEDKGILYCFDCREAILSVESLNNHLDHMVSGDVYVNEDFIRELCCAD